VDDRMGKDTIATLALSVLNDGEEGFSRLTGSTPDHQRNNSSAKRPNNRPFPVPSSRELLTSALLILHYARV